MVDELRGAPPLAVRRAGEDGLEEFELAFGSMRELEERLGPYLSGEGLYVPTEFPLDSSTVLRFRVCLPDNFVLIQGTGVVVWTRTRESDPEGTPGMAVRFAALAPQSKETIDDVVAKMLAGGGTPFDVEHSAEAVPTEGPPAEPVKEQPEEQPKRAPQKARFKVKEVGEPAQAKPAAAKPAAQAPAAAEEPVAAAEKPAAAPEEPAPAPEEPTAPPEEPAAAPEKPAAAPEEPAPAPEEPTAPPEEPAAAAEPAPPTEQPAEPDQDEPELLEADELVEVAAEPAAPPTSEQVEEQQRRQLLVEAAPAADGEGLDWEDKGAAGGEEAAADREAKLVQATDQVETWSEDPAALTWDEAEPEALEAALAEVEAAPAEGTGDELSLDIGTGPAPSWEPAQDPGPDWEAEAEQPLAETVEPAADVEPPSPTEELAPEPAAEEAELPEDLPLAAAEGASEAEEAEPTMLDQEPAAEGQERVDDGEEPTPVAEVAGPAPEVTMVPATSSASAARRKPAGGRRFPMWLAIVLVVVVVGAGGYWAVDRFVLSRGGETVVDAAGGVVDEPAVEPTAEPGGEPTEPVVDPGAVDEQPTEPALAEPTPAPVVVPTERPTPRPTAVPVASGARASVVQDISFVQGAGTTAVVISGNGQLPEGSVTAHLMDAPPRVLVKVKRITQQFKPYEIAVGSPELARIRIGHHPELRPPALYVVLDLVGEGVAVQNLSFEGSNVTVTLGR